MAPTFTPTPVPSMPTPDPLRHLTLTLAPHSFGETYYTILPLDLLPASLWVPHEMLGWVLLLGQLIWILLADKQ